MKTCSFISFLKEEEGEGGEEAVAKVKVRERNSYREK